MMFVYACVRACVCVCLLLTCITTTISAWFRQWSLRRPAAAPKQPAGEIKLNKTSHLHCALLTSSSFVCRRPRTRQSNHTAALLVGLHIKHAACARADVAALLGSLAFSPSPSSNLKSISIDGRVCVRRFPLNQSIYLSSSPSSASSPSSPLSSSSPSSFYLRTTTTTTTTTVRPCPVVPVVPLFPYRHMTTRQSLVRNVLYLGTYRPTTTS